ncbi:DNA/RNA non-specific endonuclease [Vibrio sp. FNV 38]|nr:DNA/RNA non-specific endonuclease [Vibrio sp. FNV 38]
MTKTFSGIGLAALCSVPLFFVSAGAESKIQVREYTNYKLYMDCAIRAPVLFEFNLTKDQLSIRPQESFTFDPKLPRSCQQTSIGPYKGSVDGVRLRQGQLVDANTMDMSFRTIQETYMMPNIIPMSHVLRNGGWKYTNEFQECERDISDIYVIGGAIYSNPNNDIFRTSHSIPTPNYLWKVVFYKATHVAWMFPNDNTVSYDETNKYLATLGEIESKVGLELFPKSVDRSFVPSPRLITVDRRPKCNFN